MSDKAGVPARVIRIGTRGSALALAQTQITIDRLRQAWPATAVETHIVRTEGDSDRTSPLAEIGGRGVFTNALEQAILSGRVDAAVHSAKDLPTALDAAVPIVAIPGRDDPRDVLVSRHSVPLEMLPPIPVIGTSSRRREVQIKRLRPDARIVNLRGNIDTRLKKAESEAFDAIVLAAAGVLRMGWGDRICQYFAVDQVVPSPGQGAIAVQARADSAAGVLLATIDDPQASGPVTLERVFLAATGSGCSKPVGAYVQEHDGAFSLIAMLADEMGEQIAFAAEALTPGEEAAHAVEIAARLLSEVSGSQLKRSWNGSTMQAGDLAGARVVVTRPRPQAGQLMEAFAQRGAQAIALPTILIAPLDDTRALDAALEAATDGAFDWIVFTSVNAIDVVAGRLATLGIDARHLAPVSVAVVGPATAAAASAAGFEVSLMPEVADAEHLAAALLARIEPGARLLYPRSASGREALPATMREAGVEIVVIDAYQTLPELGANLAALTLICDGEVDAITFSSPSSVGGLLTMLGRERGKVFSISAICAGKVTAEAAREAGLREVVTSDDPGPAAMVDAFAAHWRGRASRPSKREGLKVPVGLAANRSFE